MAHVRETQNGGFSILFSNLFIYLLNYYLFIYLELKWGIVLCMYVWISAFGEMMGGRGVGEKKVAGDGGLLRSRAFWSEYTKNLQTLLR